jgi:hypothetical protein
VTGSFFMGILLMMGGRAVFAETKSARSRPSQVGSLGQRDVRALHRKCSGAPLISIQTKGHCRTYFGLL